MESGIRLEIDVTTSACSGNLFDEKFATECLLDDDGLAANSDSSVASSLAGSHGAASAPKRRRSSCLSNLFRQIIAFEQILSPDRRMAITTSPSIKRLIVRFRA